MTAIFRWIVCITTIFFSCGLSAQPAVDALIPELLPAAAKAREAVVNHPTLAAYEIESTIRDAVNKAKGILKSPQDTAAAREALLPLEKTFGPLREIPYMQLHFLLGAIAGIEQRIEDQNYHRAFASALFVVINRSGKGASPETAYRVVFLAEEYDWFFVMQQKGLKAKSRVSRDVGDRKFDIWTAVTPSGEGQIYFDVSAMQASLLRVLKARGGGQRESR